MTHQTSISTYHEYILEGIYCLRQGLSFYEHAKTVTADISSDQSMLVAEVHCRYSFLMIANSLEASANALLLSLQLDKEYYEELERISTLVKFKIFCDFNQHRFNQNDVKYSRIKDLINCRNEFVHPKPKKVKYSTDNDTGEIKYDIKTTKNRKYPHYFNEIKPLHVLTALKDTLAFLSWVCFDICKLEIQDGAFRLGLGSFESNVDIDIIGIKYGFKFDKRTFGQI